MFEALTATFKSSAAVPASINMTTANICLNDFVNITLSNNVSLYIIQYIIIYYILNYILIITIYNIYK